MALGGGGDGAACPALRVCGLSDYSLVKLEPDTREIGHLWARVLPG